MKTVMLEVSMSGNAKVVIAGGGFGGVKTALQLANKPGFDVQLISNNTHFEYHGALYRTATGHSPMEVVIPLKDIFRRAQNVEVILDQVAYIDKKYQNLLGMDGDIYPYDKLVLSLGSTTNYFGIDGAEGCSYTLSDVTNTIRLRNALVSIYKQTRKRPLRIAVIGAGPTGVEFAGENQLFAEMVAKRYGLSVPKVHTILIEAADRVLPQLSVQASQKALKQLQHLGVEIHLGIHVKSCSTDTLYLSTGTLPADIIVWTAGSKPVAFYAKNNEALQLDRSGRVRVNEYLQAIDSQSISVIGDNANTPYTGMAQTALHDAKFIARNFVAERSHKTLKKYRPRRPHYVIPIGHRWAIAQKQSRIVSGRAGWLLRRQADLWIFRNFEPYKQAVQTWKQSRKFAKF